MHEILIYEETDNSETLIAKFSVEGSGSKFLSTRWFPEVFPEKYKITYEFETLKSARIHMLENALSFAIGENPNLSADFLPNEWDY